MENLKLTFSRLFIIGVVLVTSEQMSFGQGGNPTVISLTPTKNAINVVPADHVYITFDRTVYKGTGNINLRKVSDNSIVYTTPADAFIDVKINGATVEILLPFAGNNSYYVEVPNTAFKDGSNNYFAGFTTSTDWRFTTFTDVTPPAIVTQTPANSAVSVTTNTLLTLSFDETIQAGTGTIEVKRLLDDGVVASANVANPNAHLQVGTSSITISAPLAINTGYYVTIPASAIHDLYGNYFAGFATSGGWSFTTSGVSNSLPHAVTLTPANNASNIVPGDHVYITFDRNVSKVSGNINLRKMSDNSIVYTTAAEGPIDVKVNGSAVDIMLPFAGNDAYYIEVPNTAFRDANNNYFPGFHTNTDWHFATFSDTTPPTIVTQAPGNNEVSVATNSLLTINFSETIQAGAGAIQVKRLSDGVVVASADVANPNGHLQIGTTSISISAPLATSTSYYVSIPASAIRDLYNNYFTGFTTSSGWSFTTSSALNSLPSVLSLTPSNNALNVTPADHVYVTFDRAVYKVSGNINLRRASDNSIAFATAAEGPVDVKITGPTVEILLPTQKNEKYYIEIPNTAFRDANNNYFPGISTKAGWNFAMAFDAPTVASFTPQIAGTGKLVTITGTNFSYVSAVTFGGTPAASYVVNSHTSITAMVASGSSGDVEVDTPGGAGTQAGFTYQLPPSISSFSPSTAAHGASVDVIGTNFSNASSVSFGGTPASSFIVNSPTSITAVVGIGSSGDLQVDTPGGTATFSGFSFIPAPSIASFSPSAAGSGSTVIISGANFTGATSVTFGDTPAASFTINSPTSITVTLGTGSSGAVGVTTPGGSTSLAGFSFIPVPSINSFSPVAAGNGSAVVITGTYLTGATAVSFGGTPAISFTVNSSTSISAIVGAGASGNVEVHTQGGSAMVPGFSFIPAPSISSISPTIAAKGSTVVISGSNFTGATSVTFGSTPATTFTVNSPTSISAVVGTGASGNVEIHTLGGSAIATGFSFIPAPSINSFSPTASAKGSTVVITGANLTDATSVTFGDTPAATFTVNSPNSITATIGTGSNGSVAVTTPGGSATLAGFTFIPAPSIISFSPVAAGSGSTVVISGSNLTGATAVSLGGTPVASFIVNSSTSISAVVSNGASGDVSITTPGGVTFKGGFSFVPAPMISAFSPVSAEHGVTVTITGTNFTEASSVTFGGTPASSFTINSSTSISATVGTGASGPIEVTTIGGKGSKEGFTFVQTVTAIENTPEPLAIFPMPNDGKLIQIKIDEFWATGNVSMKLLDLNGRVVTTHDAVCCGTIEWVIEGAVSDGFYIINISAGHKSMAEKIAIIRK